MNISQAKCIPIDNYLQRQGYKPVRTRQNGQEIWYHSPIREDDDNPSFKVNTIKNLWYDHGIAQGGTIIDLVRELYSCDVRDALAHLDKSGLYSPALASPARGAKLPHISSPLGRTKPSLDRSTNKNAAGEKEKTSLQLISKSDLEHPALLDYLRKRKIDIDIARKFCAQIDFKRSESAGKYFGVGYPAGNGFEVRNALFKGFVGSSKEISFHDVPNSRKLLIFEGFMDFLSYLTVKKQSELECSVLILNSTNLWRRVLPYIEDKRFETIELFLDNDSAGDAATAQILETSDNINIRDMRTKYAGFDDLNAWLMAR